LDTANIEAIKRFNGMGIVDGVTTNPTLISREGKSFSEVISEIVSIVNGPVSVEVISTDYNGMVKEAKQLSEISKNVVIKIPMTAEGLKAIKTLSQEGIKTNVTLVFSANQALLAAKAGATYVSPFIGRLDDAGHIGMQVVVDTLNIFRNYGFKTEVIVSSIRHPLHVLEAAKLGAHVVTVPPAVLENMLKHPLTDAGIKRFLEDWEKVKSVSSEEELKKFFATR
jgi:transaldolase